MDEGTQERLLALNRPAASPSIDGKFFKAVRGEIGKWVLLEPTPEVFHGVEIRSIGGKEVLLKPWRIAEKRPSLFGPVWQETVPEDDGRGLEMAGKLVEKAAYVNGVEVGIRKETEEKAYTIFLRRHEQGRYGRNLSVGAGSLRQNRRIPARCPASPDQGRHEQTAFVYKDDGGSEPCGFFLMRGQSSFLQRLISFSSRSLARRRGLWGVQPSECRSLLTW